VWQYHTIPYEENIYGESQCLISLNREKKNPREHSSSLGFFIYRKSFGGFLLVFGKPLVVFCKLFGKHFGKLL
jgi:hypothetical protein